MAAILLPQRLEAQWFVEGERCVLEIRAHGKRQRFEMPAQVAIAICNQGHSAAREAKRAENMRKLARGD